MGQLLFEGLRVFEFRVSDRAAATVTSILASVGMTGERESLLSSRSVIPHDMQRPTTRHSQQVGADLSEHLLEISCIHITVPGAKHTAALHCCLSLVRGPEVASSRKIKL